jgi:hypothetical protein
MAGKLDTSLSSADGLVVTVTHEDELSWYLSQYGLSDRPDFPVVCGKGVTLVKKYGKFEADADRFLDKFRH